MNKKTKAALAGLAFLAGCEIGIALQLMKMIHKFTVRESAMNETVPDDELNDLLEAEADELPDAETDELSDAETDELSDAETDPESGTETEAVVIPVTETIESPEAAEAIPAADEDRTTKEEG